MSSLIKTILKFYLAAALWSLAVCPAIHAAASSRQTGTITAIYLNLRTDPDRKAHSIYQIKKGQEVNILEHRGKWLKISYNGKKGYVRNRERYIHINKPQKIKTPAKTIPVKKPLLPKKLSPTKKILPV